MSRYAKIINNAVVTYPYSPEQLRRDNPNVSFPKEPPLTLLADWNVRPVAETPRPVQTLTHDPQEVVPARVAGVWTQQWAMVAVSAEEAARRQQQATDDAEREEIKLDNFVQNFIGMTPTQVRNYVRANATDLAGVVAILERMAVMLLLLARREFR